MEINERTYQLIEAYLEGNLKDQALADFESRLDKEPELAQEVKLYREVGEALADPELTKFEQDLKIIGDRQAEAYQARQTTAKPRAKIRRISSWKIAAIAASVILLLVSTWLFTRPVSSADLFAAHYAPYTETLQVRSVEEGVKSKLSAGIDSYQKRDFASSITTFKELLAQNEANLNTNKPTLNLYLGLAYMGAGNDSQALAAFNEVTQEENLSVQTAHWYTALIHLRASDKQKCKAALKKVIDYSERGEYAKKAKELMGNLQ